jgi:hypothetical protein
MPNPASANAAGASRRSADFPDVVSQPAALAGNANYFTWHMKILCRGGACEICYAMAPAPARPADWRILA